MGLLDKKYIELKPTDEYLTDKVILAQAWKKSQNFIRSTNWYANTFELEQSILALSSNLDNWQIELESHDYVLTPLRLIPAPKSTKWEFVNISLFPPVDKNGMNWQCLEEASANLNQSWQPVEEQVVDNKTNTPVLQRQVPALRPLAHVPIKEQTYFTALMMCLANQVETIQGDTSTHLEQVHEKNIVNYGNRLFCRFMEDDAKFPWGNSTIYSKYFTDYQKFLARSNHFAKQAIQQKSNKEQVFEVQLDLNRFYDCINRLKLNEKIVELIKGNDEAELCGIKTLLNKFENWEWDDESKSLYKKVCQKDSEKAPLGIPQGLVAGGFLANIYLLDFDTKISFLINNCIKEKHLIVDYSRYVDDMRLVIVTESQKLELKQDIVEYFNAILNEIGLSLNDDKTKVELFQTKKTGISLKLKSIQGKVSGPISNQEIDEQLGHLEGLINLADYIRTIPKNEIGNNPLSLIEAPNHDVREDTLIRFAANKIHNLLNQKRNFYTQELDENGNFESGSWDYLQERMARKFIGCWTKDPSLVLLLKKGIELFPDTYILKSIISQFKFVINRDDLKQRYLIEYCLCEIFRHSATVIQNKPIKAFPSHSNKEEYFEYLQCLAIEILEADKKYSLNVREQARFLLLVRNDSLLSYEDKEDDNFNIVMKFMKGYRSIANDMSHQAFIFNALIAYQFAQSPKAVIRSISSFFEKISKKKVSKKNSISLNRDNLSDLLNNLAIESDFLIAELLSYANKNDLKWHKEHTIAINKLGLNQKRVKVDVKLSKNYYSLLGVIKHSENPFSHENAVLGLLKECLKNHDFEKAIDLANSKINCSNWGAIQSLSQEINIKIEPDAKPLFGVPDWVLKEHKPLYHIGMFIRSCLTGSIDWSNSLGKGQRKVPGIKSGFVKRQFGIMHSPESIIGEHAPMSSWLSNLLFHLLQWPGLQLYNFEVSLPKIWSLKSLIQLVDQRIDFQKSMYCRLSNIPGYVEKVNLKWDKDKRDLDVILVQSLLPQKKDFTEHGLMLNTPEYKVKHRRHIASVAELILHKKYSHETLLSERKGKIDLIIFPELAVNSDDIDILKRLSDKTGAIIFAGLNFTQVHNIDGPNNVAKWIIPNKKTSGRTFIERLQGKHHMMKDEKSHIKPWRPYQLFIELMHPNFEKEQGFRLTGSICFDSTDINMSADLKGKSNAYLIPSLNMDVNTFDSMVDALYYHMYQHVILVNTGEFGGSVAKAPYKKRHEKLITHVHGAQQVSISSFKMNMFDFRDISLSYCSGKEIKTKPAG